MGFKDLKKNLIACLMNGNWEIDQERKGVSDNNLLYTGEVTIEEVINMVKCCTGDCHTPDKLHRTIPGREPLSIDAHVLKPIGAYHGWYIKFYFIDPKAMILSVHESGKK